MWKQLLSMTSITTLVLGFTLGACTKKSEEDPMAEGVEEYTEVIEEEADPMDSMDAGDNSAMEEEMGNSGDEHSH